MKILTFGVFDYFHYGHLKLFKKAKQLGDYLIVAIQRDEEIKVNKPDAVILYNYAQRSEMVKAIRFVDEVVEYTQVDVAIKKIDFDILAVGEDQIHSGFIRAINWCKENKKTVIQLKRTPNICSSEIKKKLL